MDPLELIDNLVNGRPTGKVVRVKLTDAHIEKLKSGKVLDFKAGLLTIVVSRK